MPTLKLAGRTGTPARKSPARKAPARKPAGRKPAAAPVESAAPVTRGPKLPEGWTKADFNRAVKEMQKAHSVKTAAAEKLAEAQELVNTMALELLDQGVQMSVISVELDLSRQWMYTMLKRRDEAKPKRGRKPAAKAAAKSAPVAKRRPKPAAKAVPARKRPPVSTTGKGRIRIAA